MKMNEANTISPETLRTEYVSPETCVFSKNKNGFLAAIINGKEYKRVILSRSLPLSFPNDYICISDVEKNEIGIVEHMSEFSNEQQKLMDDELSQRYYCPVISSIESIKEKMGHFYFDVKIGEFKKSFTVRDISKSIRQHGDAIDLIDIDGNRFRIIDFASIPAKSRRKLEPYLY
ncbi:MAG: DUF1854 domain-containing protein [Clostridia bacterium]|nr:DUF1854 domain-containing protein [Clostridia bacterium]